jgi:hypothetical protein
MVLWWFDSNSNCCVHEPAGDDGCKLAGVKYQEGYTKGFAEALESGTERVKHESGNELEKGLTELVE